MVEDADTRVVSCAADSEDEEDVAPSDAADDRLSPSSLLRGPLLSCWAPREGDPLP